MTLAGNSGWHAGTALHISMDITIMTVADAIAALRDPESSTHGWDLTGIRFNEHGNQPRLGFTRGGDTLDILPADQFGPLRAVPGGCSEDDARSPKLHGINIDACENVFAAVAAAIAMAPVREAEWISDLAGIGAAR